MTAKSSGLSAILSDLPFVGCRVSTMAGICGVVLAAALQGCGSSSGPEVASVAGTVTVDGTPLSDAMVTFSPVSGGRESYGVTDQNGRYLLRYNSRTKGAELGEHEVRICAPGVEPKGKRHAQENQARIPPHYSGEHFLRHTVERGVNEIPLILTRTPPNE
jgi:hypothetical protein